jgi:hypothetical protein
MTQNRHFELEALYNSQRERGQDSQIFAQVGPVGSERHCLYNVLVVERCSGIVCCK